MLPIGTTTLQVAISAVDATRTIVFGSEQSASGQGGGETSYVGSTSYLSEGHARYELASATNVNVIRARSSGVATLTFYVVEFDP